MTRVETVIEEEQEADSDEKGPSDFQRYQHEVPSWVADREREDLRRAMSENWLHARHVETLRNQTTNVYWLVWAGALAYVGTGSRPGEAWATVFFFVAVASAIAFAATLKWSSEFANHMAAIGRIAYRLRLNVPDPDRSPWLGSRTFYAGTYLPYGEFHGVMALPLPAPLILNVGPLLTFVEIVGFGLALGIFAAHLPFLAFGRDCPQAGPDSLAAMISRLLSGPPVRDCLDMTVGITVGLCGFVAMVICARIISTHTERVIRRRWLGPEGDANHRATFWEAMGGAVIVIAAMLAAAGLAYFIAAYSNLLQWFVLALLLMIGLALIVYGTWKWRGSLGHRHRA